MTALAERIEVMALVADAVKAGARQDSACACAAISFSERGNATCSGAINGQRVCRSRATGSA